MSDMQATQIRAAVDRGTGQQASSPFEKWKSEEPGLIRAWQEKGCEKSLTTLLKRYEGFFRSQANRIINSRSMNAGHREDLIQEAQLAFIKAATSFDPKMGTGLSTHAINHVRPALLQYTLDYRSGYRIGTSSNERKALYMAIAMRGERAGSGKSENFSQADIETIATRTGAPQKTVKRAISSLHTSQTDITEDTDVASDETLEASLQDMSMTRAIDVLKPFIETLDERRKAVLISFLSNGDINIHDLAARFDVTPERLGQIRRTMFFDMEIFLKQHGIKADDLF